MMDDKKAELMKKGVLLLLPLVVYAATMSFGYALDDALYITDNSFTKEGFGGIWDHLTRESLVGFYGEQKSLLTGGRYRPLASITYSIEYALYGFNPSIGHLINVLLYSSLLLMLYQLSRKFITRQRWLNVGFVALLFFAVHPLHVEVVANIKGRDQILGLMVVAATALLSFEFFEGKKQSLVWMSLLFFLGLLAKESTITFLPIIPLIHYFFRQKKTGQILPLFLSLLVASVAWFALRSWALQGFESVESTTLLNDPYLNSTMGQKWGTTIYTWLLYLKLLLVPHPLTYDYYPFHISIREFTDWRVMLSLIIHLALVITAIIGFKKRSVYAFLIILYAATFSISSNLFFNIGTFMNERFMFEPSLAFCLLAGLLIVRKVPERLQWGVTLIPILIFAVISFNRTFAWKDNYTLFTTDVKTSAYSIKGLMAAGGILYEEALLAEDVVEKNNMLDQSIEYLERAISLLPTEINCYRLLGRSYIERDGIVQPLIDAYQQALRQNPGDPITVQNVESIIQNTNYDAQKRLNFALAFREDMPESAVLNFQIGTIYGQVLGSMGRSIAFLSKAVSLDPDNVDYLNNLATAQAISQDFLASIETFQRVVRLDANNKQAFMGLSLGYQNLGDLTQANYYRSLAEQ